MGRGLVLPRSLGQQVSWWRVRPIPMFGQTLQSRRDGSLDLWNGVADLVVITDTPKLDLESYIQNYRGWPPSLLCLLSLSLTQRSRPHSYKSPPSDR